MVSLKVLCASCLKSRFKIEEELKVGHGFLTRLLNNSQNNTRISTMEKVSKYFNVPIDEIEEFKKSYDNYKYKLKSKIDEKEIKKVLNDKTKSNPVKVKKSKTIKCKPFKCLNQACPLNKKCLCQSPIVTNLIDKCDSKDKITEPVIKEKSRNFYKQISIRKSYLETHNGYYHGSY